MIYKIITILKPSPLTRNVLCYIAQNPRQSIRSNNGNDPHIKQFNNLGIAKLLDEDNRRVTTNYFDFKLHSVTNNLAAWLEIAWHYVSSCKQSLRERLFSKRASSSVFFFLFLGFQISWLHWFFGHLELNQVTSGSFSKHSFSENDIMAAFSVKPVSLQLLSTDLRLGP
ncbi:hypothetical protein CEXT_701131 [Caerostris extrusa]|uniref:Uncharacterized protein n=1 Tax=Caerostris extrusa TaxID=172846 RepID=A0AAV4NWN1_CAEEX|nr:hypothetical protein CEXT_701131 [Caerostris extrusa]